MTKHIILTLLAAAVTATAGNQLIETQSYVDGSLRNTHVAVSTTYASQELWRGVSRGDDSFQAVVTGDIALTDYITTFAGVTLRNTDAVDSDYIFTGGIRKDFSNVGLTGTSLAVLFNYYTEGTNVSGDITSEIGVELSQDVDHFMLPVDNVTVTQYLTTEGTSQSYGEVDLTKTVNVFNLPIDISGSLGYVADESEYTHAGATISTDIQTGMPGLVVTPYVSYIFSLGDDTDDLRGIYVGAEDEVAVGFRATYNF